MNPWFYALASVAGISLISLIGLTTLSLKEDTLRKFLPYMICLAVGAMFGNAFLHMIPEAFEHSAGVGTGLIILAGFFAFFLVEKGLHCKHECHTEVSDGHGIHPVGMMSLLADGLENLVDGAIIGAAYMVDVPTGIAATVAVFMHELPTEIGDFGVLVHSGYTRKKALLLNLATASAALIGAIASLTIGSVVTEFTQYVIPFAAGAFVYIAAVRLMPRIVADTDSCGSNRQIIWMLIGVGAMLAMTFME